MTGGSVKTPVFSAGNIANHNNDARSISDSSAHGRNNSDALPARRILAAHNIHTHKDAAPTLHRASAPPAQYALRQIPVRWLLLEPQKSLPLPNQVTVISLFESSPNLRRTAIQTPTRLKSRAHALVCKSREMSRGAPCLAVFARHGRSGYAQYEPKNSARTGQKTATCQPSRNDPRGSNRGQIVSITTPRHMASA
jgi:hypothetical protein